MILCVATAVMTINEAFMSTNSFPKIFGISSAVLSVVGLLLIKDRGRYVYIASIFTALLGLSLGSLQSRVEDRSRIAMEAKYIHTMENKAMTLEPYTILHGDSSLVARSGEQFTSKYTILNFWAPWCPPCLKEMPLLDGFYNQMKKEGIQVIGITGLYRKSDHEDKDRFLTWAKKTYTDKVISYPIIFDEEAGNALKFKVSSFPLTVLLDHKSRIIEYRIGIKGAEIVMDRVKRELNVE